MGNHLANPPQGRGFKSSFPPRSWVGWGGGAGGRRISNTIVWQIQKKNGHHSQPPLAFSSKARSNGRTAGGWGRDLGAIRAAATRRPGATPSYGRGAAAAEGQRAGKSQGRRRNSPPLGSFFWWLCHGPSTHAPKTHPTSAKETLIKILSGFAFGGAGLTLDAPHPFSPQGRSSGPKQPNHSLFENPPPSGHNSVKWVYGYTALKKNKTTCQFL